VLTDPATTSTTSSQPEQAAQAEQAQPKIVGKPGASTSLTAEQRSERARNAALARHSQKFDWEACSLDDGLGKLADLRAEMEKASLVMQRRVSEAKVSRAECYNPECRQPDGSRTIIDIGTGRFAGSRTRENPPGSRQYETAYACSAGCFMYLTRMFSPTPPVKVAPHTNTT